MRLGRPRQVTFVDPAADLVFVSASEPGEYLWEVDGSSTPVRTC